MDFKNEMTLIIESKSSNEALARVCVAAFASQTDPTVSEISDIKVAVSEAVTNSIIHGYDNKKGQIYINCKLTFENEIIIEIKDTGLGIDDVGEAMTPLYTSKPESERSGMGFTVMETFMDGLEVFSERNNGTKIIMRKKISQS